MIKKISVSFFFVFLAASVWAQVTTSSSYSSFGIGELSRKSTVFNKGMGGTGYGMKAQNEINLLNPASLSIDSLTFLLDIGLSSNQYSLKDGNGNSAQTGNTGFEYLAFAFPVTKWWNASIGLFPYTKIGYSYEIQEIKGNEIVPVKYSGSGGINQAVISQSFSPIKPLSLGVSCGVLFGQVEKYGNVTANQSSAPTNLYKNIYNSGIMLEAGVLYAHQIKEDVTLSLGGVVSVVPTMKYRNRSYLQPYILNTQFKTFEDSTESEWMATDIAPSLGGGIALSKKDVYSIGFDASMQQWSGKMIYGNISNGIKNSTRFSFGGSWIPNRYAPRGYYKRISYRLGVWYEDTYIQAITLAGNFSPIAAKGVTLGVSLPFRQTQNKIQLAVEYGQRKGQSADLISENFFIFSFGLRIHENWFYKRKFE